MEETSEKREARALLYNATDEAVKQHSVVASLSKGKPIQVRIDSNAFEPMVKMGETVTLEVVNVDKLKPGDFIACRKGSNLSYFRIEKKKFETSGIMLEVSNSTGRHTIPATAIFARVSRPATGVAGFLQRLLPR